MKINDSGSSAFEAGLETGAFYTDEQLAALLQPAFMEYIETALTSGGGALEGIDELGGSGRLQMGNQKFEFGHDAEEIEFGVQSSGEDELREAHDDLMEKLPFSARQIMEGNPSDGDQGFAEMTKRMSESVVSVGEMMRWDPPEVAEFTFSMKNDWYRDAEFKVAIAKKRVDLSYKAAETSDADRFDPLLNSLYQHIEERAPGDVRVRNLGRKYE